MSLDIRRVMIIKSLDEMEEIVQGNPNLVWEGWDVLWYRPNGAGFLKKDGAFFNGTWTRLKRITPSRDGWHLPKSLLKVT
jgi:hypothetical protein